MRLSFYGLGIEGTSHKGGGLWAIRREWEDEKFRRAEGERMRGYEVEKVRRWESPDQHWADLKDFHPEAGDIKNIWEASRFEWVVTLARAYAISGDDWSWTSGSKPPLPFRNLFVITLKESRAISAMLSPRTTTTAPEGLQRKDFQGKGSQVSLWGGLRGIGNKKLRSWENQKLRS
jgi:hypothetical protein